MKFDAYMWIAFFTETHKLLNLARSSNPNGIRQTNALHTGFDDGIKDGQQINQVAAKGIFGGEAHIASG